MVSWEPGQNADIQTPASQIEQLAGGMKEMPSGMQKLQGGMEEIGKNLKVTTVDKAWGVGFFGGFSAEMLFAEQRPVIPSGIVLLSPNFGRDTPAIELHGKSSCLGAGFQGPEICGVQSGGLILTYFYGEDYLADLSGFFLARGYGELKNDFWRFSAGADGDVINPLKPHTLDFNAGQGAGNLGFFRGQFRVER